jgi:hypothetical protein
LDNNQKKSNLRNRGIITLRDWCNTNGYPGVTKECLLSASNSDDPRLRDMAKNAEAVNKIKEDKVYGR